MDRTIVVCCGTECELPAFLDMRGLLAFWILWELRLGPLSGVQIGERLAWRRGSGLSPGTLYPALASLEEDGLVRKRRDGRETTYEVTSRGEDELACAQMFLRIVLQDVVGDPFRPRRTAGGHE